MALPNRLFKNSSASAVTVKAACKRISSSDGKPLFRRMACLMSLEHAKIARSCAWTCIACSPRTASTGRGGCNPGSNPST